MPEQFIDPPLCPKCGKLPWRPGHGVVALDPTDDGDDLSVCVCMHCSSVWGLQRDPLRWRALTEAEDAALPEWVRHVGRVFAEQRIEMAGDPHFQARADAFAERLLGGRKH